MFAKSDRLYVENKPILQDEKLPMTVIVGLVAKDGVVVAADSQASSFRGVPVKRCEYAKIHELGNEKDDIRAVIAGAGTVAFINKAVGEVRNEWNTKRFTTVNDFENAIESSMVKLLKRYVIDRMRELGISDHKDTSKSLRIKNPRSLKGLQELPIQAPNIHLLVAACDEAGNKLLATVGPDGITESEDTYTTAGSGSAYAEYILGRLYTKDLDIDQAVDCAVYTVEEVKKIDPACGGPARAVAVTKKEIRNNSVDDIRELVGRLEFREELLSKMWRTMVLGRKSPSEISSFLE